MAQANHTPTPSSHQIEASPPPDSPPSTTPTLKGVDAHRPETNVRDAHGHPQAGSPAGVVRDHYGPDAEGDVWELNTSVVDTFTRVPARGAAGRPSAERLGLVTCISQRTGLVLASCTTVGLPTAAAHMATVLAAIATVRADPTQGGFPGTVCIDRGTGTLPAEAAHDLARLGIRLHHLDMAIPAKGEETQGAFEHALRDVLGARRQP